MNTPARRIRNRCACLVARIGGTRARLGGAFDRFGGDRGATATEYAILVGFVAVAIAGSLFAFGQSLNDWYQALAARLDGWL
jgi:pilus assembly protein Flp/PilA